MIKISFKHDPDIKQPHAEIPHIRHSEAIRSDLRKGNNQNCESFHTRLYPLIQPAGQGIWTLHNEEHLQ